MAAIGVDKGNGSWCVVLSRDEWQKLGLQTGLNVNLSVYIEDIHNIQ